MPRRSGHLCFWSQPIFVIGGGHSLGEIIGYFLVLLRSNRDLFESSAKISSEWCPEQAVEALVRHHRPLMST